GLSALSPGRGRLRRVGTLPSDGGGTQRALVTPVVGLRGRASQRPGRLVVARVVAVERREPHRVGGQTRYLPRRPSNLDSASPARPGTRHGVAAGPVGPALITPAGPRTNHPRENDNRVGFAAGSNPIVVVEQRGRLMSLPQLGCRALRVLRSGGLVPAPAAGRGRVASVNAPTG